MYVHSISQKLLQKSQFKKIDFFTNDLQGDFALNSDPSCRPLYTTANAVAAVFLWLQVRVVLLKYSVTVKRPSEMICL